MQLTPTKLGIFPSCRRHSSSRTAKQLISQLQLVKQRGRHAVLLTLETGFMAVHFAQAPAAEPLHHTVHTEYQANQALKPSSLWVCVVHHPDEAPARDTISITCAPGGQLQSWKTIKAHARQLILEPPSLRPMSSLTPSKPRPSHATTKPGYFHCPYGSLEFNLSVQGDDTRAQQSSSSDPVLMPNFHIRTQSRGAHIFSSTNPPITSFPTRCLLSRPLLSWPPSSHSSHSIRPQSVP